MSASRLGLLSLVALLALAAIYLTWPREPALVEWTAADLEESPRAPDAALNAPNRETAEPETGAPAPTRSEPHTDDDPARMLTLRGRVVDTAAMPIPGAQITIELSDGNREARVRPQASTDRDGRFALRGPLRGARSVGVLATHPAFAPNLVDREVRAGGDDTVLVGDIVLGVGGSLRGVVTDATGSALAGATVQLSAESNSRVLWSPLGQALFGPVTTDAAGGYRFERVPAGPYRVHARATRHVAASSAPIQVRPGEATELPPLRLAPGCALRVELRDDRGAAVERGSIALTPVGKRGAKRHLLSNGKGQVEFDHLEPAVYEVLARATGRRSQRVLVEPCRTPEVTVPLAAGLAVHGLVQDAGGRPIDHFAVQARRVRELAVLPSAALAGLDRAQLQSRLDKLQERAGQDLAAAHELVELEAALASAASRRPRETDWTDRVRNTPRITEAPRQHADGRFTIDGLDEGIYVVDVKAPGLRAARSAEFELRAGGAAATLTFALQPGVQVRGKVVAKHDQRPLARARVEVTLLPPDQGLRGTVRGVALGSTLCDDAGQFTIEDLETGNVAVRAWADGYIHATTPPFLLTGDRDGVVVELEAYASLRGRVRDVPPGREGDVMVVAMATARSVASKRADPDGRFAITELEAQTYRVRAYLGRSGDAVRRMNAGQPSDREVVVQLAHGEQRDVELALTPVAQGGIRGRVRSNGQPGVGLHVSLRDGEHGAWGSGVSTEPDGSFAMRDVDAGAYQLVIAAVQRERVELSTQPVTIVADHEAEVAVDLQTAALEGEVVSPDGQLTGDGVLRIYFHRSSLPDDAESEAGTRYHSVAVRNGRFRADPLPAGQHFVDVRAPAPFTPAGEVVQLAPGDHRTVRLQAGPARGANK